MVLLAVLSDIHANWYALDGIISTAEFQKCDQILFCGDAVGYYYQAEQVLNFLEKNIAYGVMGNHDEFFQLFRGYHGIGIDAYTSKYGTGLIRSLKTVSEKNCKWLADLPESLDVKIENKIICISHGSPMQRNGYIYKDSPVELIEPIFKLHYDCVVLGHSHHPFVFQRGKKLIVNPGSVGQPRDKGGYAGWATLEVTRESICVNMHKTMYDVNPLINDVKLNDPNNSYLTSVLIRK